MPKIERRKVRVTVEYETAGTDTNGELVDRITGRLEGVSRDLVKNPASNIGGYKITYISVTGEG